MVFCVAVNAFKTAPVNVCEQEISSAGKKKKKTTTLAALCSGISMEYRPTYRNCCLNVQKSKTELDKNKSS
jgi:hypothetical protein